MKFSEFLEEPSASPESIQIVGLDAEGRNARFPGSLLFGQILSNAIFAGGDQGAAAPQLIPPNTWTAVEWENIYSNTSDVVLLEDKITWRRDAGIERASGLWTSMWCVAWENTDAALVSVHRRRMRVVAYYEILSPFWNISGVQSDSLFHPDMGDLTQPSYQSIMIQDGWDWAIVENEFVELRLEVWHNAETSINIVPNGYDAPLFMSSKISEWDTNDV